MSHHHLTRAQRSELGAFMVAGLSQVDISVELGVHPSTICRELKRCQTSNRSGYQAQIASFLARQRRAKANSLRRKLLWDISLRRYVTAKLKLDWSPEQICGRLAVQHGRPVLSHETIYAWVYRSAPHLKSHLRHGGSKYRKHRGTNKRWMELEKLRRRWIDDRPEVVTLRARVGDWEGDTMVGTDRKSRLLTCTDRKSGYELAAKLDRATHDKVADEMVRWFDRLPRTKKHTLTFDNGIEFNQFEYIEAATGLAVYFCHPYSSWERGTNENTNGLLRQYFPKKTSFEFITQDQVDAAVHRLNTRPRKRLGYQTPREVFRQNCVSD